ncbi:hypothetical protein EDC01DRAFT_675109 [Geopyxis carbonaria]|nr:hypothetical protein EDC01DRAFT_675109 [Geopyxis carbonaria]
MVTRPSFALHFITDVTEFSLSHNTSILRIGVGARNYRKLPARTHTGDVHISVHHCTLQGREMADFYLDVEESAEVRQLSSHVTELAAFVMDTDEFQDLLPEVNLRSLKQVTISMGTTDCNTVEVGLDLYDEAVTDDYLSEQQSFGLFNEIRKNAGIPLQDPTWDEERGVLIQKPLRSKSSKYQNQLQAPENEEGNVKLLSHGDPQDAIPMLTKEIDNPPKSKRQPLNEETRNSLLNMLENMIKDHEKLRLESQTEAEKDDKK